MKIHSVRSYALGIAAALIALPGFATMPASAQSQLVSANAVLTHSLNSSGAKTGQSVTAKLTSAASQQLPKGTMLVGKIDDVQSGNGTSKLTITFDQARLSNGQQIPIKATLLAAYPPAIYSYDDTQAGSAPIAQPRTISSDEVVQQDPSTLNGVGMQSSVQSNTSAVFTSDRNIKLASGTMLQVAIAPQAGSAASASAATGAMQ